jgi:hypothetical protein
MDAPARIDDRGELVARADGGGGRRTQGAVETGTIPWKDAECRYQGPGHVHGQPQGSGMASRTARAISRRNKAGST